MATNPKMPDYRWDPPPRPDHEHAKVQILRKGRFPWPLVGLIAIGVLLLIIIAFLPKTPRMVRPPSAAQIPQQPTVDQVQLTNLKISPAPAGDALYLTGVLHNTGNTQITGVQVQAEFLGRNGPVLAAETRPVESLTGAASSANLTQASIKPNESRPVRIYFEHTPKGWNHRLPELTVTEVTGTTP
jgi:hypothetical protein